MVSVAYGNRIEVVEDVAADIRAQWARVQETGGAWLAEVMKLGGMLVRKKAELGHGKFGKLFRGSDKLPFSERMAQRVMACFENTALTSNPTHVAVLPHDIETVSKLALVPPAKLTKLIESGEVNANTTREEAAAIVRKLKGKPEPEPVTDKQRLIDLCDRFERDLLDIIDRNGRLRPRAVTTLTLILQGVQK